MKLTYALIGFGVALLLVTILNKDRWQAKLST